jgi:two-component system, OmpR family, sensor histidine kinase KdpD
VPPLPESPSVLSRRPPASPLPFRAAPRSGRGEYRLAAGVVALVTAIGLILPDSYYLSLGLIYLLTVILLSLRVGRGPLLMAGLLSAGTWDYVFIPPHFQFQISTMQDGLLVGTYLVVALVSGQFAGRIRAQAIDERLRKERATALFNLSRTLTEKQTLPEAVDAGLRQADELFAAQSSLLLAEPATGRLTPYRAGLPPLAAPELAAAEWAFRHRQSAGRSTLNPQESAGTYLPLLCVDHAVGVLGLTTSADLTPAQHELLEAFAHQLALIVEREYLRTANEREKLLAESEKLHRALLDSVSHELRTPLAVITGSLEHMDDAATGLPERAALLGEMRTSARRLNRLVANLLDQTRLESGALRPRLDWCDAADLINSAIADARDALAGRPLEVSVPDDLPSLRLDFALTEQALGNLLLNAALHTPAGTPIFISAGLDRPRSRAFIAVSDRGPGLTPAMLERLFLKFARGDAARAGGLGLGLSIARGFIVAQGGEIAVDENPGGGARFAIYLPHTAAQPEAPE